MSARATMIMEKGTAASSTRQAHQVDRIVAICPTCEAMLSVRRVYIGHQVLCKKCGHIFPLGESSKAQSGPEFDEQSAHDSPNSVTNLRPSDNEAVQPATIAPFHPLTNEHGRLKDEHACGNLTHDQAIDELRHVTIELDGVRGHLGMIAPEEVRNLAAERDSLPPRSIA